MKARVRHEATNLEFDLTPTVMLRSYLRHISHALADTWYKAAVRYPKEVYEPLYSALTTGEYETTGRLPCPRGMADLHAQMAFNVKSVIEEYMMDDLSAKRTMYDLFTTCFVENLRKKMQV